MEGTFGGLKFVRNQMGFYADPADFIQPQDSALTGDQPVAVWTWNQFSTPLLGPGRARGKAWEMSRYRDYRAQLAGRLIGDTIGAAAELLTQVFTAAHSAGQAGTIAATNTGAR